MQLIEQRLELVIGDLITRRSGRCSNGCNRSSSFGGGRELAFAMQLIEQRFELVIGDLITCRCASRRRSNYRSGRRFDRTGELPLPCN